MSFQMKNKTNESKMVLIKITGPLKHFLIESKICANEQNNKKK